jgi:coniferyl-aldehyde dehydrogenase
MALAPAQEPARDLRQLLELQRAAFLADPCPAAEVRTDRLGRLIHLLTAHQGELCDAVAADFGQRPAALTSFTDVFPAVHALRSARRNVRGWMKPRGRRLRLPAAMPGARGQILYQPLGVIGVLSPWNFPINLTFGPLAGIVAAGNRCLLKPSELTPLTSALMEKLVTRYFGAAEIAVVTGGRDVASSFSRLPFDHLLFTGSTQVGRQVMAAAAEHLVPVTLELGGKCPVIIGRSARLERAVDRILLGKLANAGQLCLAPDYVWLPRESLPAFVEQARAWARRAYPGLPANPDYTSLINPAHLQRAEALLADARVHGAEIVVLGTGASAPASRLLNPALILHATDRMRVMQEEIFAPLLPVLAYTRIEEVLTELARRERPLALYYFGTDRAEEREILHRTISGGVTVNDIAMHFLAEELPFGGIGASGMGAYHGEHGFQRFSHARAVFRQSRLDVAGIVGLRPPYGARVRRSLKLLIRR